MSQRALKICEKIFWTSAKIKDYCWTGHFPSFVYDFIVYKWQNNERFVAQKSQIDLREIVDSHGNNLLTAAVQTSNIEIVDKLLKYGFNPNDVVDDAYFILQRASTDKLAIDTFLCLLRHNARLPDDFVYEIAPLEIQNFIDMCESLHKAVDEKDWKTLVLRLKQEPDLIYFYDRNNESLFKHLLTIYQLSDLTLFLDRLKAGPHEQIADKSIIEAFQVIFDTPSQENSRDFSFFEVKVDDGTLVFNKMDKNITAHECLELSSHIRQSIRCSSSKISKCDDGNEDCDGSKDMCRKNICVGRKRQSRLDESPKYFIFDRHFIPYQQSNVASKKFSEIREISKRVLLIGESGAGKSASLKLIANKLKAKRVDLSQFEEIFEDFYEKTINESEAVNVLQKMLSLQSSRKYHILVFDGFDAVNPIYHKFLVSFFQKLENPEFWIAVRPENYEKLKEIPATSAYTFEPFDYPQTWLLIYETLSKNNEINPYNYIKKIMIFIKDINCTDNFKMIEKLTEIATSVPDSLEKSSIYSTCSRLVEILMDNDEALWRAHKILAVLSLVPNIHSHSLTILKDWKLPDENLQKLIRKCGLVSVDEKWTESSIKFANPTIAEFFVTRFVLKSLCNGSSLEEDEKNRIEQLFDSLLESKTGRYKDLMASYLIGHEHVLSPRLANLKQKLELTTADETGQSSLCTMPPEIILHITKTLTEIDILNALAASPSFANIFSGNFQEKRKFKLKISSDTLKVLSQIEGIKQIFFKNVIISIESKREVELLLKVLKCFKESIQQFEIVKADIFSLDELKRLLYGMNSLGRLKISNSSLNDEDDVIDELPNLYSIEFNKCNENTFKIFKNQTFAKRIFVNHDNFSWTDSLHEGLAELVNALPGVNLVTFYGCDTRGRFQLKSDFPFPNTRVCYGLKTPQWNIKFINLSAPSEAYQDEPMDEFPSNVDIKKQAISKKDPHGLLEINDVDMIEEGIMKANIDIEYVKPEEGRCVVKVIDESSISILEKLVAKTLVDGVPLEISPYSPPPKFMYIFEISNYSHNQDAFVTLRAITKSHDFDLEKGFILAVRSLNDATEEVAIILPFTQHIKLHKIHPTGSLDEKRIAFDWNNYR